MENFLYINKICLMGKDITIEKSSFSSRQNQMATSNKKKREKIMEIIKSLGTF